MPERAKPLSQNQRRALIVGEVLRMAATVLLVALVWFTSVHGRSAVVHSLRDGCTRSQVRVQAEAEGFSALGQGQVAHTLLTTVPSDCALAYPDPGWLTVRSGKFVPMGVLARGAFSR